ncbi:MAG TPA: formate dehydrogenase subunit delta [Reyranella sp.]|nr:formate dehydrogenase subunit delta [Reyranella sp.]
MSSYDGKLVMMANQIGRFYGPQKQVDPATAIATHIRKFWDPRMRAAIVAHLDQGGVGLDPPVHKAVERLKAAP